MPSSEFSSWLVYFSEEPFGTVRDNYHAGIVASTMANCHSKKAFNPDDFMLKTEREVKRKNFESVRAAFRSLAKKKPCPEKNDLKS